MMTGSFSSRQLADRYNLTRRAKGWVGTCPACGYRETFSLRDGRGGKPYLHCFNGCTRDTLDEAARQTLGCGWMPAPRPDDADEQQRRAVKQEAALRLWRGSTPCAGTVSAFYLANRGIGRAVTSEALRFRGDCGHPEGGRLPAMVALVQDVGGQSIACHRTYLNREGDKANVVPVKASLGPVWGGAVRLDPAAMVLVIGEGIESAASAGLLLSLPAWAAISAGNLAKGLLLPPDVREVVIAVDPDPPGERAAAEAAVRWQAQGRHVRIARPNKQGHDFNALLQSRLATEAHHG